MHKIKIVHLIGSLNRGGAERFVIDLCNEIAKIEKYEVYILSLCSNSSENTYVKDIDRSVNYLSFHKGKGFSFSVLLKLTTWLKEKSPHIIHSHLNGFEYLCIYRLLKTRATSFHTIHNVAKVECSNILLKAYRKIFYKNNSVIPVTISVNGSKTYREYYGLNNEIIIENARPKLKPTSALGDLRSRYNTSDEFLLVHVGRIATEKNQQLLIESVQYFNNNDTKKCRLLIIGDNKNESLYSKLQGLAKNDTYIEFLGGKDNISDYLNIADAFCLSSMFEGMPISLIESMSLGCIPICTPVGGIKEMIKDGVTGFLSKDTSLESYCDALKRAVYSMNKDDIRKNLISCFETKYHIGISAKNHLSTYNKALNLFEGRDSAFELLYKSKF